MARISQEGRRTACVLCCLLCSLCFAITTPLEANGLSREPTLSSGHRLTVPLKRLCMSRATFLQDTPFARLQPRQTIPPLGSLSDTDDVPKRTKQPRHLRWFLKALNSDPVLLAGAITMAVGTLLAIWLSNAAAQQEQPPEMTPSRPPDAQLCLMAGLFLGSAMVGYAPLEAEFKEQERIEQRRLAKRAEWEEKHYGEKMFRACCQDLGNAYLSFEASIAAGEPVRVSAMEHLMYRLTKGEDWAQLVQRNNRPNQTALCRVEVHNLFSGPCTPVSMSALECMQRIYERLQPTGRSTKIAVLMARALAQAGDAQAAEAMALEEAPQQEPKVSLRCFTAALVAWASRGEHQRAAGLLQTIRQRQLHLTECEYALLWQSVPTTTTSDFMEGVLWDMQRELEGELQPSTIDHIRAYFEGIGASIKEVTVQRDGLFNSSQGLERLKRLDMPPEELQRLRSVVENVAKANNLDPLGFKDWLAQKGPFDVVIDAANVALFRQNSEDGFFRFKQIHQAYQAAQRSLGLARPLVILHHRWLISCNQQSQLFLKELNAADALYTVHWGYDDLLWVYAALLNSCPFITNDNLADVHHLLGAPEGFHRWVRQQRIVYKVAHQVYLHPPLPYTVCVQNFQDGWMLPQNAEGTSWLQINTLPPKDTGSEAVHPAAFDGDLMGAERGLRKHSAWCCVL
eukprot:GGOE01043501.1.p1 GENE.GGOE01043501.1~~GGOE01043501.1.p1  ORF type:complete len:683 (-),score=121.61 GGOE01043501.1:140-2188(-)